jgi:hypothetical protein
VGPTAPPRPLCLSVSVQICLHLPTSWRST